MPWKFVCDLRFHGVLLTTITRQITNGNEEIEKSRKIQSKTVRIVYISLYVLVRVCVCVWGGLFSCLIVCRRISGVS